MVTFEGLTCDFEDAKICGYTQPKNDDFDWSRNTRTTGSAGTGPSFDHTYGTSNGETTSIKPTTRSV